MADFKTRTYGKWIFSGEHSVLRGGPALVFPLFKKKLDLEYINSTEPLAVKATGENAVDIIDLFPGVLNKALELLGRKNTLTGTIIFSNELPLGSGMGASSSLCVGFSRWLHFLKLITEEEIYEFARQLENIFHGESSGVDIAVVLREKPLIFKRPDIIETLNVKNPYWLYLSHTGQKGITKDCVSKVNQFIKDFPELGKATDQKMIQITMEAIELFVQAKGDADPQKLVSILDRGYECFRTWGLTKGAIDQQILLLKSKGALAAKPTGSGGGGYVLSLWPSHIQPDLPFEIIPTF